MLDWVLAFLLVGLLIAPLTMRSTRSRRALTTERGRSRGLLQDRLASWFLGQYQEFRAQLREADRLDAVGSAEAATTCRLSAIITFIRKCSEDQLIKYSLDIHHNLVATAARKPSGAVAALAELKLLCPQCASRDITSSVIREWARGARSDSFADDLTRIGEILTGTSLDLLELLLDTCRSLSRDELSVAFRRGVSEYLWTHLDRSLRVTVPAGGYGLNGHSSAFELLDLVGPTHLPRAGQLCALGDLALARSSVAEALARYDIAVKGGSQQARERLAYHRAREGHRLLLAGQIPAAGRKFAEAWALHKDQEYALLDTITEFLGDAADTGITLDRLGAFDVADAFGPPATFWRAIVHLRRGEQDQAVVLLRSFVNQQSDSNQRWGPVEDGAVLLAVLEKDDQALVDWARRLISVYGHQWLSAGSSDPWPLVATVARRDRDLLTKMVTLVGNFQELPEWVRNASAHALLTKSIQSARGGQIARAASEAELAQRLLRG
jgi:hypothetical protein